MRDSNNRRSKSIESINSISSDVIMIERERGGGKGERENDARKKKSKVNIRKASNERNTCVLYSRLLWHLCLIHSGLLLRFHQNTIRKFCLENRDFIDSIRLFLLSLFSCWLFFTFFFRDSFKVFSVHLDSKTYEQYYIAMRNLCTSWEHE